MNFSNPKRFITENMTPAVMDAARDNDILKHTRYKWLKNYYDLSERERDRLMSVKSLDLQTSHAYHFKGYGTLILALRNHI
ncbi:transposase [Cuniculiplasma sp. SKW3]|uniref:transposase n=1 Tax=Cuniculiplasma sp. SKW3 TaxID=3400170 RepID=UPI003FD5337B